MGDKAQERTQKHFSTFGDIADRLVQNGYLPVPLLRGQKRPALNGWTEFRFTTVEPRYAKCGVGLLTGQPGATGVFLVGIDCDVRRASVADDIKALAVDMLDAGGAPSRVGMPPKQLFAMRAGQPFAKMATREFRFPDDDPEAKGHRVEILGHGQQFVAFGIHPDTRKPYTWNGAGDPLGVAIDQLPLLDEAKARAYIDAADAMLLAAGGIPGGRFRRADAAREHASNEQQQARDVPECREAIAAIPNDDLAYDDWVYVGMALKGALGDDGADDFDAFSHKSAKYDEGATRRAWHSFKPTKLGAGTLYFLAEQAGWPRDARVGQHAPAVGGMQVNAKGNFFCTLPNVATALQSVLDQRGIVVYYSVFYDRLRMIDAAGAVRQLQDSDVRALWARVQLRGRGFEHVGKDLMYDAVAFVGDRYERDEAVEWLDALKWDGIARLDALCDDGFGVARTEYHMAAFKNLLVASVARQYKPGTKFDHAVVLISPQGVGKTRLLGVLFGDDHVARLPKDPTTKDAMLKTRGKLCVELDEMGAIRGKLEQVKSWITETVDEYRDPYGRLTKRHPRRFVVVGTTNSQEFLEDDENRRWWPVEVGEVNLDYLRDMREQLFAEAVVLHRAGYAFWKIPADAARAAQKKRELGGPWDDLIARLVSNGRTWTDENGEDHHEEFPHGFVLTADLQTVWLNLSAAQMQRGTAAAKDLAKAMRAAGYKKVRGDGPNNGLHGWVPEDFEWNPEARAWTAPGAPAF